MNSKAEMIMSDEIRLTLERLTTFEQFCALKDEWNALATDQVKTIFMTHLWLEEWWQAFGAEFQIWTLLAREDGILVGILPLMLTKEKSGVCKLQFMGAGELTPNHLDIIVTQKKRNEVVKAFAAYLGRVTSEWNRIELDKFPEDSPSVNLLKCALQDQGLLLSTQVTATCPYAELPSSFEEYVRSRSSTTRESYRRARRRIAKDFPNMRLAVAESPDEVWDIISVLVQLHQNRWLKRGYTGTFSSQRIVDFHHLVAVHALQENLLRLYSLQIDDEIIAIHYCYRVGNNIQYYLGAFDEKWSRYSPGNIINMFAIEQSILEGAKCFDFLEGKEDYKTHWMTHSRNNVVIMAFKPDLRGRVEKFRLGLLEALKHAAIELVPQKIRRPVWKFYLKWNSHRQDRFKQLFSQN